MTSYTTSLPDDTIAAIASAPGGASRGVVRVSGANTGSCLVELGVSNKSLSPIEQIGPTVFSTDIELADPIKAVPCDIYYWPTNRSYTRQPTAEIHTLGSPPLLSALLHRLCEAGARMAEPGEFTLRAFLAGRLDLTQAEAVLGAIDAKDRSQLDVALSQLAGGLSAPLTLLRSDLLELLAHLEASLDFVDEDIQFITSDETKQLLHQSAREIRQLADQLTTRRRDDTAFRVVLTGSPNAGKSSLLNKLARDEAAIVSSKAGTTRDYVSRSVQWQGHRILLIDTAGIESSPTTDDRSMEAAQQATVEQLRQADIELLCIDSTSPDSDWRRQQWDDNTQGQSRICVMTKIDVSRDRQTPPDALQTSSITGEGLSSLRDEVVANLEGQVATDQHVVAGTAARCRQSLAEAAIALSRGKELVLRQAGDELVAEEVRTALDAIGRVVGAVYTDDLLDNIFSRFCIGK